MSISLWILIRPETRGVVLSAGDQSWPGGGRGEGGERKEKEKGEKKDYITLHVPLSYVLHAYI